METELVEIPDSYTGPPLHEGQDHLSNNDPKLRAMEDDKELCTQGTNGGENDSVCGDAPAKDEVRKCIQSLPWGWDAGALTQYLQKKNVTFVTVKKRKGMNVGFVSFKEQEHALDAGEKLGEESVKGKRLKVTDVLPRSWEAGVVTQQKLVEDQETEETSELDGVTSLKKRPGASRDVCDAVTPLAALPYEEQLIQKKDSIAQVLRQLVRHTRKCCPPGVDLPHWIATARDRAGLACTFDDVLASPTVDGYRNKCEFSTGYATSGELVVGFQLGMFREGITAVAEPTTCRNVSQIAKFYAKTFQDLIRKSRLPVWNKQNNSGFWRMLTVREGRCSGKSSSIDEVMLIVQVCTSGIIDEDKELEYKGMRDTFALAAASASPPIPLTALFLQDHTGISNAASADAPLIPLCVLRSEDASQEVADEHSHPVGYIHDYISDLKFRISPTAFFQVNTLAAERLYSLAGDWADLTPETLLFDICCGTGTIGLTLARRVGMVVGIEMNSSAVADARINAEINHISNCRFVCAKAEDVITGLLNEYILPTRDATEGSSNSGDVDISDPSFKHFSNVVVIVDPPRSGLHPVVVKALRIHKDLKRLVYISCNPETLTANAVELCAPSNTQKPEKVHGHNKGMTNFAYARRRAKAMPPSEPFRPVKATAVDLFPHTHHCEMVMLFER